MNDNDLTFISAENTFDFLCERLKNKIPTNFYRLGDGELLSAHGIKDSSQHSNVIDKIKYKQELIDLISLNKDNILFGLPYHSKKYGYSKNMNSKMHLWNDGYAQSMVERFLKLNKNNKTIYSSVWNAHNSVWNTEKFLYYLKLIRNDYSLFVGGENNNDITIKKLFNVSSIIKTPIKNSYNEIDKIEEICLSKLNNNFNILILSCGCCSKILQHRISSKINNVYFLDIGSFMEIFKDKSKWSWVKKIDNKHKNKIISTLLGN